MEYNKYLGSKRNKWSNEKERMNERSDRLYNREYRKFFLVYLAPGSLILALVWTATNKFFAWWKYLLINQHTPQKHITITHTVVVTVDVVAAK